jgi:glycosyltransferase involved in cell wall biosynthesis
MIVPGSALEPRVHVRTWYDSNGVQDQRSTAPRLVPQVSAILLTYNCARFVREAIRGVFEQDWAEPLQVVVSDDASTDGTYDIACSEASAYHGPYAVTLRQRRTNSGSKSAHLNDVLPSVTGDIIVSFDGDDVSERSRIRRIAEAFRRPGVHAVYSSYSVIDSFGCPQGGGRVPHPPSPANAAEWFARADAYAAGATLAVRRAVFEAFGPLDPAIHEDVVLPFRASLLGDTVYIDEPLVRFRRHAASLTADLDRFASLDAYRERLYVGIERAQRGAKSRLEDINRAIALMPDRATEFRRLQAVVADSVAKAELTAQLVDPSLARRAGALLRLACSGAYREELLQHVGLALAPGRYLRYKRRAFRVAAEGG